MGYRPQLEKQMELLKPIIAQRLLMGATIKTLATDHRVAYTTLFTFVKRWKLEYTPYGEGNSTYVRPTYPMLTEADIEEDFKTVIYPPGEPCGVSKCFPKLDTKNSSRVYSAINNLGEDFYD